jgi:hypothetical protein
MVRIIKGLARLIATIFALLPHVRRDRARLDQYQATLRMIQQRARPTRHRAAAPKSMFDDIGINGAGTILWDNQASAPRAARSPGPARRKDLVAELKNVTVNFDAGAVRNSGHHTVDLRTDHGTFQGNGD